jgi:DNA-binding NtrC family response regulator
MRIIAATSRDMAALVRNGHLAGENPVRPLAQQIAALEKVAFAQALQATPGNKAAAALALGISRAKLYERLDSLQLKNE